MTHEEKIGFWRRTGALFGLLPGAGRARPSAERLSLAALREELVDRALRLALVVGLLALVVGGWKSFSVGRGWVLAIYVSFYMGLVAMAVLRGRVSFTARVLVGWFFLYGQAAAILATFGLSGAGLLLLIALCMLASYLLGLRAGVITALVSLATVLVVAFGMTSGWIPFDTNVWLNSLSTSSWFQGFTIFGIIAAVAVIGPGLLLGRLDGALRAERLKTDALEQANQLLKEEMEARREAEDSRDELEVAFKHAQKMEAVGRLAGGVAHDFNNLLTSITGNVSLARMDVPEDTPLSEVLIDIEEAAEKASVVTSQLLAFSRKQMTVTRVVDLNELIDKLVRMLGRLIGEDIELSLSLAEDLSAVDVDPGQIEQVVVNLAVNARDAMPRGGHFALETSNVRVEPAMAESRDGLLPGDYVRVRVKDDGCGMAPDIQERIFDPFFTTKKEGVGTGLGLATVYGILKRHGGHVEVASRPGRGSRFDLYLPAADGPVAKGETPRSPRPASGRGGVILLVEDEASVRRTVRRILARQGYEVYSADRAATALSLLEKQGLEPDLLLTDVVMPGMNGRELAERLRAARPELKVLLMSGYSENILTDEGHTLEGVHFLAKPYASETLAAKVREILAG